MHFTINDNRYIVEIAARPVIVNSNPCRGMIDYSRRHIWIADQHPRHERRRTLLHELRHAWIFEFGMVEHDEEADAIQAANMMDEIFTQYLSQGGDSVLERLNPEPQGSIWAHPVGPLARVRFHCGQCQAPVAVGSVHNTHPAWNQDLGGWSMERRFECGACGATTAWAESCTYEGMPLEVLAHPQPRMIPAGQRTALHGGR